MDSVTMLVITTIVIATCQGEIRKNVWLMNLGHTSVPGDSILVPGIEQLLQETAATKSVVVAVAQAVPASP